MVRASIQPDRLSAGGHAVVVHVLLAALAVSAIAALAAGRISGNWSSALGGGAAVACGAVAGAAVLRRVVGLEPASAMAGVLAASGARLGAALVAGIVLTAVRPPEPRTFWLTLLAAGLLCIVAEAIILVRHLNQAWPVSLPPA